MSRPADLRMARDLVAQVMATLDATTSTCGSCQCPRHRNKVEWQLAEQLSAVVRKLEDIAGRLEHYEKQESRTPPPRGR